MNFIFIISGLSGSGKTTVSSAFLKNKKSVRRVITSTTRKKRSLEKSSIDYFFYTKEEFLKLKEKGFFIETNEYEKNLYGVEKKELKKKGKKILITDIKGAIKLKSLLKKAIFIWVKTSSLEETSRRLIKRDGKKLAEARIAKNSQDLELFKENEGIFEHQIASDNLASCLEQLKKIIFKSAHLQGKK